MKYLFDMKKYKITHQGDNHLNFIIKLEGVFVLIGLIQYFCHFSMRKEKSRIKRHMKMPPVPLKGDLMDERPLYQLESIRIKSTGLKYEEI